MNQLDLDRVTQFVNENIGQFHRARLEGIQKLSLRRVLQRKNPYLFKAKNVHLANELVTSILEASLSASEEGIFGHFLEELAIFINEMTFGGQKSATTGLDLEFTRDSVRYIVAIKSGPNWGNSSQYAALKANFKSALKVLRQSQRTGEVRAVLGICYGKCRNNDNGEYLKLCGQPFWEFISGEPHLYLDIIEPLGYQAKEHNEAFLIERDNAYNRFVREFTLEFCNDDGSIDWQKLVDFNSGSRNQAKS